MIRTFLRGERKSLSAERRAGNQLNQNGRKKKKTYVKEGKEEGFAGFSLKPAANG